MLSNPINWKNTKWNLTNTTFIKYLFYLFNLVFLAVFFLLINFQYFKCEGNLNNWNYTPCPYSHKHPHNTVEGQKKRSLSEFLQIKMERMISLESLIQNSSAAVRPLCPSAHIQPLSVKSQAACPLLQPDTIKPKLPIYTPTSYGVYDGLVVFLSNMSMLQIRALCKPQNTFHIKKNVVLNLLHAKQMH